jgi:hypothetical protein
MRLFLLITMMAAVMPAAGDPWTGTWNVVWASASHNFGRMTITEDAEGLRLVQSGEPPKSLRLLDDGRAEYSIDREGRTSTVRCTVSADGNELIQTGSRGGRGQSADLRAEGGDVYDRIYGAAAGNRFVGIWVYNEAKTVVREAVPTVFEVGESGALRFRRGSTTYIAQFDGKEYPVSATGRARTVSLKRINERAFEMVFKNAEGNVIQERRIAVFENGKLMQIVDVFHPAGGGHHLTIFRRN